MISEDLDLTRRNFLVRLNLLSPEDQQKGISSALIAEWVGREIEFVDILMPLLGFKRFRFSEKTYWIDLSSYDEFRKKIDGLLLH